MTDFVFSMAGGKFIDNAETLGAVSSKTWTVPTGKRWLILGAWAERDQNATLDFWITTSGDKVILASAQYSAGTSNRGFGVMAGAASQRFIPFPLDAGYKVVITWGAAQLTPEVALCVLEVDIE